MDDIILRVTFREQSPPYKRGETYLLTVAQARPLRAAGVLHDRCEVCDPQVAPVSAVDRAAIAELFAPPPPPPEEEPAPAELAPVTDPSTGADA